MLRNFLRLLSIYMGVVFGLFLDMYVFDITRYGEFIAPLSVSFVLFTAISLLQITFLVLITSIFVRKKIFILLSSLLHNFVFGSIFSSIPILLSVIVTPKMVYLDNTLVVFIIIPLLIYLVLLYISYLLFRGKWRNKATTG